jgi:integrase
MSFTRTKFQQGCLTKERRKSCPAVWIFRFREDTPEGRKNRKVVLGPVTKLRTKGEAWKTADQFRLAIRRDISAIGPANVAELVKHYTETEMTEKSNKSFSTRKAYQCYFKNWILPMWGPHPLADVRTVAVENWLRSLDLARGTKAKVRNIMSVLFTHAMRYEWLERNPIKLVRQSARRETVPEVLTAGEIQGLLRELSGPYKVMVFLAATTGLRVSELLALKWNDFDFASAEIRVGRAVVCQVVGRTKTEASSKPIPLNPALAEVVLDWRACAPYSQSTDWVFASPDRHGTQPLWPSSAMSKHIRPAAKRAGIAKHVRWHVFRHTFGTLLKGSGEDVKTTQELMRHANASTTMDIYVQAITQAKREAQGRVVNLIQGAGAVQ